MESFLGTAMAGSMFCLFAGQPLIILSSTGPILIFEKLLFDFSKWVLGHPRGHQGPSPRGWAVPPAALTAPRVPSSRGNGIDYMEFRLWIGLHSALQCLILVATDASFIIKYITRFTEEGFSTLISFIFIYDAIKKMIGAFKYYPINSDFKPDYVTMYKCECVAPDPGEFTPGPPAREPGHLKNASFAGFGLKFPLSLHATIIPNFTNLAFFGVSRQSNALNLTALDWTQLSKKECLKYGGSLVGKSCKFVPDLALMSFILFFGTYSMTLTLKKFKFSRYFPTKVSKEPNSARSFPRNEGKRELPAHESLSKPVSLSCLQVRAFIADFSNVFSILLFCAVDACFGLDTPKLHIPSIIKLRKLVSDFSIFMSILMFVGLDILFGLNTPKLQVPTDFKPTRVDRGWFVFPFGKNPWWVYLASALPALLVTILIFMDQQITAVIVNRKEHKLRPMPRCRGPEATPEVLSPLSPQPTRVDRGWFVFPFGKNPWWVYLASALPALLVTILIFMDQQITAVIVNRKEHKLRKAAGYHLDLFWVGILMAVCSFMGLPWYVAATVISIAHIDSLKMETETSAPGEQPQFLGVREQRVTGIIVFILTGISVFLAPVLKKAAGYHLDLFWVGILMAVCSFMGLPWYVAATVISIAHIDSLKMETETSAPGEQPQFLGVREQRVTGIIVFILTGISVFLAPVLKYIPMPVLYGVFLYMGVASLNGIQFWDRCKLFLMPAKHQPDYVFLRHVPLRRIHLFTLVQIVCLAVLWILKSTVAAIIFPVMFWDRCKLFLMPAKHQPDYVFLRHVPLRRIHLFTLVQIVCLAVLWILKSTVAAIIFPVMILALILVRRLLDFVFSQHDLAWIDNIIPEKEKKKEDDKKKKKKANKGDSSSDEEILALILVRRLLDFVFSQHDLAWIDNIIPEKEKKKEDDKKKKKKANKGDSSSDEEPRLPQDGAAPAALRSDSSPNGSDPERRYRPKSGTFRD
ncbi:Electrogenic sodium bicarbonate cotransporter 4 [Lonchura striata]|uniref:Electrogenic sodium bicarbonate cotransporter 4 n=1 Tax=Lonchura striata TaxID=40157 RepID=A0A218UA83_9PASE|nr:Electrogenic sodium bicarbonate cotransporter 4 [Lonchura striata domestica]